MMSFIKRILNINWEHIASCKAYARHLGVSIGRNYFIATRNWSLERYLVRIGNNVYISKNVSIHTHGGAQCMRKIHPDFDVFGKVMIENWAYIGMNSQIMPSVTIGEGALVAAGSIVIKSVTPHTVVGGTC